MPNLRDVGGYPTRDGSRVRMGLLYRSNDLGRLADEDFVAFVNLGIRTVYDLRTSVERMRQPDRLPPGVICVAMDVLVDSTEKRPDEFAELFADPEAAHRILGNGAGDSFFLRSYREFVRIPSARAAYGRLFSDLARGECTPAIVHCTGGKDRTGWAVAALLLLLGVEDGIVERDYLLTNTRLRPMFQPLMDEIAARGVDPTLFEPFLTARPEYLAAALEEMRGSHGTIERYFADGLGVDAAVQVALRRAFVEPA